jgi:hypothetical protein
MRCAMCAGHGQDCQRRGDDDPASEWTGRCVEGRAAGGGGPEAAQSGAGRAPPPLKPATDEVRAKLDWLKSAVIEEESLHDDFNNAGCGTPSPRASWVG